MRANRLKCNLTNLNNVRLRREYSIFYYFITMTKAALKAESNRLAYSVCDHVVDKNS